jgi:hypothetical protein
MQNLSFYGNWRRILLLGKASSFDIDEPVEYITLDARKLATTIEKFCERNWNELGFDFDPYSYFLWPLDDKVSAVDLADQLNERFPHCASVVRTSPADAHGLGDLSFDEEQYNNALGFDQPG